MAILLDSFEVSIVSEDSDMSCLERARAGFHVAVEGEPMTRSRTLLWDIKGCLNRLMEYSFTDCRLRYVAEGKGIATGHRPCLDTFDLHCGRTVHRQCRQVFSNAMGRNAHCSKHHATIAKSGQEALGQAALL